MEGHHSYRAPRYEDKESDHSSRPSSSSASPVNVRALAMYFQNKDLLGSLPLVSRTSTQPHPPSLPVGDSQKEKEEEEEMPTQVLPEPAPDMEYDGCPAAAYSNDNYDRRPSIGSTVGLNFGEIDPTPQEPDQLLVTSSRISSPGENVVSNPTPGHPLYPLPKPRPRLSLTGSRVEALNEAERHEGQSIDGSHLAPEVKPRTVYFFDHLYIKEHSDGESSGYCTPIAIQPIASPSDEVQKTSTFRIKSKSDSVINKKATNSVLKLRNSLGLLLKKGKLLSRSKKQSDKQMRKSVSSPLEIKPEKPTRSPPLPPPLIQSRPPAPLPSSSSDTEASGEPLYEDTSGDALDQDQELYSDAHDADLYATLDGCSDQSTQSSDHYEDIDSFSSGSIKDPLSEGDYDDLYADSGDWSESSSQQIYEMIASQRDDVAVEKQSLDSKPSQEALYDQNSTSNSSINNNNRYQAQVVNILSSLDRKLEREQKLLDRKRASVAAKLRKKFSLTGDEVPVNSGLVKEDAKRSRSRGDLGVRSGETVLILRLEGNPPGKWLAKDERGKTGYVQLSNVAFDPETVKTMMRIAESLKT